MLPLYSLAFLSGILLFQQLPQIPASGWLGLVFLISSVVVLQKRLRIPVFVLLGFGWAHVYALYTAPEILPASMLGTDVQISGTVFGIPVKRGRDWKFLFDTQSGRFSLTWYKASSALHAGERWQFRAKLKPVHGFMNPGGFDYEGWNYRQNIRYKGYIRGDATLLKSGYQGLHGLRHWLTDGIDSVPATATSKAVIQALVVGDKSNLNKKIRKVFQTTGTSHLMAISGLHVGLVAGFLYQLVTWVWRFMPRLCQRWPANVAGAIAAIAGAVAYAALAGFTVPTQRALIMLMVVMFAVLFRRKSSASNTLAIALMLVLLFDPPAVLSAGFWLSFIAVAVLLLLSGASRTISEPTLIRWMKLQLGITLGLLPVLLFWQLGSSMISPLVNLIAIPVFGMLVVPLSLLGSLLLWPWPDAAVQLLSWCAWLIDYLLGILIWLAKKAPESPLPITAMWPSALLAFAGMAILLAARKTPGKPLALLMLLPLILPPSRPTVASGNFRFDLLDVGQGLAAVVRTRNHTLVYDTGPKFASGFETGSAVIVPFLRTVAVSNIDRLVISHGDSDHAGGVSGLASQITIQSLFSGEPERLAEEAIRCQQGQQWQWDGVNFSVLYPPEDLKTEGNEASCVLRVSTSSDSLLLTGDIEKFAESWLLANQPGQLASTVVVAPHHGSKTSSTAAFVTAVGAKYVLFPAGFANRWGFPAETVTQRWVNSGARHYTTAQSGSISMEFAADGVSQPVEYRAEIVRYWHHL